MSPDPSPSSEPLAPPALAVRRRGALLAMLLVVPAPIVGVLAAMVLLPGPIGNGIFAACKLWMLAVPVLWHRFVDREPLSLSPARHGGFGLGAGLGLLISAIIVATYFLVGRDLIDPVAVAAEADENNIGEPLPYLGAVIYWIAFNSLLEEYVYRWFLVRQAERLMPSWAAILVSAGCFTLHHILALGVQMGPVVTILGSAGIFIGGAAWSWLYVKTRSIWPGYVSHAIVDVAVFAIGWELVMG